MTAWQPIDTMPTSTPVEVETVTGIVCVARAVTYQGNLYVRPASRGLPRRVPCLRPNGGGDVVAVKWRPL